MYHSNHGKQGTMLVTRVDEPSKYGVVIHEREGLVRHFVEKPSTFVGNHINAGIYLFDHTVLDRIEPKPHSLEKDIFPLMAEEETLCAMLLPGYWMDIG
jgi:mannose-1-phosphate guanylyltransferase